MIIFWVLLAWLVMEFLFSCGRTIRDLYEEELERQELELERSKGGERT